MSEEYNPSDMICIGGTTLARADSPEGMAFINAQCLQHTPPNPDRPYCVTLGTEEVWLNEEEYQTYLARAGSASTPANHDRPECVTSLEVALPDKDKKKKSDYL